MMRRNGENGEIGAPAQRRRPERVTMSEVAKSAAVSPSTVSLYLRRPEAVSARAASRIAQAIDSLAYVPNRMAGGLAGASSKIVSIIVPSLRSAFFAETVAALQSALAAADLQVLLGHSDYSARQEEALVRAALSWDPTALVLTGLDHSHATRNLLKRSGIPVIEMWELGESPIDMLVGFSHREVGIVAARHLLATGRRRIAFLGARMQEDRRARERAAGFAHVASDGTGHDPIVLNHPGPANAEAGSLLLKRALDAAPDLDGIATSNDLVALGVVFECQRRGIAVPEHLSIIGFGDMSFTASCVPPLTTIRPSGDIIGREVARLILARRNQQPIAPADRIIDTGFQLIERRST
jgi:LacI family transcriptional regulator, gluconate utilization system Gnt-I transcriptional repressor